MSMVRWNRTNIHSFFILHPQDRAEYEAEKAKKAKAKADAEGAAKNGIEAVLSFLLSFVDKSNDAPRAPVVSPHKLVMLRPGLNLIPDADWAEVKRNRNFKSFVRPGTARGMDGIAIKGRPAIEEIEEVRKLASFDDDAAVSMVEETVSPELLDQWKAADTRLPVKNAIDKRMLEITAYRKVGMPENTSGGYVQ